MELNNLAAITAELRQLGLSSGDHVLARAALGSMTNVTSNRAQMLMRALLSVVGSQGTIVALTFSNSHLRPNKRPDQVFDRNFPSVTGGFAEAVRTWPGARRSRHPLNSFSAIGAKADEIIHGHDVNSACFAPMEKLIGLQGKMVLIGCVASSPGFSTVHLAQFHLGLSYRTWMSGLGGILWRDDDGTVKVFRRRDIPGCSAGFSNYYSSYVRLGLLKTSVVGGAYSAAIACSAASRATAAGLPSFLVPIVSLTGLVLLQAGLMLQPSQPSVVLVLWLAIAVFGAAGPAGYVVMCQMFPPEQTGRVSTAVNTLTLAGAFLVQAAIGWILDLWPRTASDGWDPDGYSWALALTAAFQTIAALVMATAQRRGHAATS